MRNLLVKWENINDNMGERKREKKKEVQNFTSVYILTLVVTGCVPAGTTGAMEKTSHSHHDKYTI